MLKSSISQTQLAVISLALVGLSYSLLGMVSRILSHGFAPMTQVYVRVLVGFVISLLLFSRQIRWDRYKTVPKSDWLWLLIMGVIGYALGVWAIVNANINAKLVNSAVIYSTIPFVVYIYAFFLLKEKIRLKLIGLLLVTLYGIGVVAAKSFLPVLSSFGVGEWWAVVSVLLSGWWSIGIKKLSGHLSNREVTAVVMAIAGLAGLLIALLTGEKLSVVSFFDSSILFGIALGAILNVVATFFENYGFRNIDVVIGNQILMLSTVFSLIFGWMFYRETISLPEVAGGLIILVSVFIANRSMRNLL